jgi:5-methylcytosine-specific restriction endonuclease McrA
VEGEYVLKRCLREPISEIFEAATLLSRAVFAHLAGDREIAASLIRDADRPAIREWTESLWGAGGPWTRPLKVQNPLPYLPRRARSALRMPTSKEKAAVLARDGYHCRFCGIPIARAEIRMALHRSYPDALPWGSRNIEQHAGFQAVWLQYDHILPHARGGGNELDNILITCAPCNNGRSNLTLEEAGLADPRLFSPLRTKWDGLELLFAK